MDWWNLLMFYYWTWNQQIQWKSIQTLLKYMLVFYINICCGIFVSYKFLDLFRNVLNPKTIKLCLIITIHIQKILVNSYWFLRSILYLWCASFNNRWTISRINTIEFAFVVIISLYFKSSQGMRQNSKFFPAVIIPW